VALDDNQSDTLHIGLPKGRMQEGVFSLLADAGIELKRAAREYRPRLTLPDTEAKILKPQNIIEMLDAGSRDVGFAGADWVAELEADVVELFDTGLDPVRLVAAAPTELVENGRLRKDGPLVVVSEYERLARNWIEESGLDARFVKSFGATEVFPPEDADCIVDITQTGATLEANGLEILDQLRTSSTRLYANPRALENPAKRRRAEDLVLLLRSVLEARKRLSIEVNVPPDRLEAVVAVMPCMREPTVSTLHAGAGYAVKAAVLREELPIVLPRIRAAGGVDVIVTKPSQIVP